MTSPAIFLQESRSICDVILSIITFTGASNVRASQQVLLMGGENNGAHGMSSKFTSYLLIGRLGHGSAVVAICGYLIRPSYRLQTDCLCTEYIHPPLDPLYCTAGNYNCCNCANDPYPTSLEKSCYSPIRTSMYSTTAYRSSGRTKPIRPVFRKWLV